MGPDLSVFDRIKTKADYDRMEEEFQLRKQQAIRQAQGTTPASIQIANEIRKARQAGDTERINDLTMSGKLVDRGVVFDQNGNPMAMGGYGDAVGSIAGTKKSYEANAQNVSDMTYDPITAGREAEARFYQQLQFEPDIEREKEIARANAEKLINQPKEKLRVDSVGRQADNIRAEIYRGKEKLGKPATGGWLGGVSQAIPGTPAFGLKKTLATIKGNLGFAELQAMRDASPTGGALGQVAVQELEALQSTIANLDLGQSDEDLAYALTKIEGHINNWQQAVNQSYEEKYGSDGVDPMEASRNAVMKRNEEVGANPYGTLPEAPGQPAPPKKGQVVGNYMFLGGDPSQQSSWKKVK